MGGDSTTETATKISTTDVTEDVTSYSTESVTSNITQEDDCNVTSYANRSDATTLQVTWSGLLDDDSPVILSVSKMYDTTSNTTMSSITTSFGNGSVDITVEPNSIYIVNASFECPVNNRSWMIPVPAGAPNLKVEKKTNTSVCLTWDPFLDPLRGPLLYVVSLNGTFNETLTTSFDIQDLDPYVEYTFQMYAEFDGIPQMDWSDHLTVRTDVGVPHAPTALNTTSVGNTSVGLTWEAPSVSTGPILGYWIQWKDSKGRKRERDTGNSGTSYKVVGLVPYEQYTLAVLAETEAGPGNWSEVLEVQMKEGVPHAPTALNTTWVGNTTVGLTWEEPAISTGPILEYRLRWKDSNGRERELDTGSNETSYDVDGLSPYERYTFAVSAETKAGPGNWSEDLEVQTEIGIPHAPTGLNTTSVGNTTVGLTWKAPAISTGPILKYWVRWKDSNGRGRERDTGSNETSYDVDGLSPYERYTLAVSAETKAGPGNWSEDLEVRTEIGIPHTPTGLSTTSVGNTTVGLTWKAPAISTGPIVEYRVRWKDSNGKGFERDTGSNKTSYDVEGLSPYERYIFAVLARTQAGSGNWSEDLEVQTEIGVPRAPTALNTTWVGNTTVGLTWEAPVISTGPIIRYRILWKDSNGRKRERDTGSNETSYEVHGLAPYEWYTFGVLAETKAGRGNWSEDLEVHTEIGVPHEPTALNTTSVGNTTVGLTWKSPAISTGPILEYRIRWEDSNGRGRERDTGSNRTSHEVDGLTPYERYTFVVSAKTESGRGNWSEDLQVQMKEGVPSVPRNFGIGHKTDISLQISWSRPEFIRSAKVQYEVSWRVDGSSHVGELKRVIEGEIAKESFRYVVSGLLPYTHYVVQVSAMNQAGRGPATRLQVQTKVGVPKAAVMRNVSVLGGRTVRITWSTEGPFPGPVEFSVQAWKYPDECSGKVSAVADKEVKGKKSLAEWTTPQLTTVDGLTPFAVYTFVVLLRTEATDGVKNESSKCENLRMPAEAPGRPQHVAVDCRWSSTQARVSWSPPISPNGRIVSYEVLYGVVGQYQMTTVTVGVTDICSNQSHVISGMRPERRYYVNVTAMVEGVSEKGAPGTSRSFCILPAGIPHLGNTSRLKASSSAPHHLNLEWTADIFSDYMGEIVRYSVLVGRETALGESAGGKNAEEFPTWSNFSSGASEFYQATPPGWNPFGIGDDPMECQISMIEEENNRTLLTCIVGAQWPCPENETYCNGPLEPDTLYELKIRGFTRGGYNETQPLHTRTGRLPEKSIAGAVSAAVLSLLMVGLLAGGCYVMKRKGILEPIAETVRIKLRLRKANATENAVSGQEMERNRNSRPITTKHFSEHVRRMMSDSHLQFSQEFEELKTTSPLLPCTVAESEENRLKNRWMNIFPFDHSRVKLLPLCDEPGSDFINASYIPGPSSPREYIASQGPLPHTLDDFWRMVWEQSVTTIVMLTQCTERGKRKCEMYWPEAGEARHYGDLSVVTVSESMLATHVIRVIRLQLGSYDRQVKQIHFMHWPDFGCPDRPEDLIEFVGAVRDHLPRRNPGPILVHCSAGVGRTGTFIAVDRLRRQLRGAPNPGEDDVDVYGMVLELRHHRTNMVQTEDQYIYIHSCVEQMIWARDHPTISTAESIYSNVGNMDTSF